MSVSDNIALFNSKIDQTYWTERVINNHTIAILPDENYYKLLQKPYIKVGENSGTSTKYSTSNFAEYFACRKTDDTIAVVNSVKTQASIPTKISVATYYAYYDENERTRKIAILNRFDQMGHPHENHLDVYGAHPTSKEYAFYKKYLADFVIPDAAGEKYQVKLPHVHFNTRSQTVRFNHHDKANAISIEKLMEYIADLKAENDPSAIINNIDMGMPFLDLKNAKLTYSSTMLSALGNIVGFFEAEQRVRPDKFTDYEKETVALMKSLINIDPDTGAAAVAPSPTPPDSPEPVSGPDGKPVSSPDGGTSGGSTSSSGGSSSGISMSVSRLNDNDFRYIIEYLPPLDGLRLVELYEVKSHLSKYINYLEKENKESYREMDVEFVSRRRNREGAEQRKMYKEYLKYVKGMINLESISKDLKKYMMIYEVLNERDNLLMSFVSKELLKNLTMNIKSTGNMEKGGVSYDTSTQQPH